MIPPGVEGTWAPVIERNAAGQLTRQAWYFNSYYPWVGMLICAPIIGLWYWCTDQYIVQRALGAPNENVARKGSIFAAFLKLFPPYLFIIPGLICFAVAKSGKIPELAVMIGPDGKAIGPIAQGAFPMMVQYLLPPGLRGLVVAGLLSALMGSLAGVFNACSTLFTVDLYSKWKPQATQKQMVHTGRIATATMVLIALAWIPVIKGAHGLYNYLQAIQGYLAPPIFVVFFLGVFWKRSNAAGALWAMIIGFVMGIVRMLVDTPVTLGLAGLRERLHLRLVLLDPEQHLLPVLQRADHDRVGDRDGGREPRHSGARLREDPEPDVRHRHGRGQPQDARELGLARGGGLRSHPRLHHGRVPVLPRLEEVTMRSKRGFALTLVPLLCVAATVPASAQAPPPPGFTSLFNGRDLSGWEVPAGDNGHWKVVDGVIDYDAMSEATGDKALWTQKEYADFVLRAEWRIKETPYVNPNVPIIRFDGTHKKGPDGKEIKLSVPDSDSGIYLRGSSKSQVNIWCWPIGSGEVYGYRMDDKLPPEVRGGVTPRQNADRDVGEWNAFEITMKGDRLTVVLNGITVIENAQLPGVPAKGPLALQHHGDKKNGVWSSPPSLVQFRNIAIQELR